MSAIFSLLLLLSQYCYGAEQFTLQTKLLDIASPNNPCLYDIDADQRYEVIISGVKGDVAAYELPSLKTVWHCHIPTQGLSEPAVGDLLGTGVPILVMGSMSGKVFFYYAGSGHVLDEFDLGKAIAVAATIVPNDSATSPPCDGVALCDVDGGIHYLRFDDGKVREIFTIPNSIQTSANERVELGRVNLPPSVGDIDGDKSPEIIAGTALGKVVAVSVKDPTHRLVWHAPQGLTINTNVVCSDVFGFGRDSLVFGTNSGNLFAVVYDPSTDSLKTGVGKLKLSGAAVGHLLAADFDGDSLADVIGATENAIFSFIPSAGFESRGEPYGATAPPFSSVSLAPLLGDKYAALVTDAKGSLHILDPQLTQLRSNYSIGEAANSIILCGNLTQKGIVEAVYLARNKSRLAYMTFPNLPAPSDLPPTMTYGGNYQRNGLVTTGSLVRVSAAVDKFRARNEQLLSRAKTLYDEKKYDECQQVLQEILRVCPSHKEARTLQRATFFRKHSIEIELAGTVALGIIAIAAWLAWKIRKKRTLEAQARTLIELEAYPQAAKLLRELWQKEPSNKSVLALLAEVYTRWERSGDESLDVLEAAHRAFPENSSITLSLAKAYANLGIETDEALELYQIALAVFEEDRGQIAYHAARIFEARGEVEQAIRCYKIAKKEGAIASDISERLVELYLATNQFTEKTLPEFEEVYPARTTDARFLEGLCRAQAAARRVDDKARASASNLLALNPNAVIALRQLAKCELQAGRSDKALSFAEKAYELAPTDDEALLILAYAYAACEVITPKALDVFRKSLDLEPTNPSLLRCAALGILTFESTLSEESYELLEKAVRANPQDRSLLRAFADASRTRQKLDVAKEAYERLLALGDTSSAVFCGLAEIYAALGETGEKCIAAYEEALRVDPENVTYLTSLAKSLVSAGRKDPTAISLIEKALLKSPASIELGVYLATYYMENERYEDALKLSKWLLQSDKDNEELQKLVAQASFKSNRLDEAIAEYQYLLAHHPDDVEARVNLALAFARKHRTDAEAAECYESALRLSPDQPAIRFMLARHHAMAGRYGAALDQLREILRLSPEHTQKILDEIRLYLAHAPDRPDLRWFFVTVLTETGAFDEACENLETLLTLEPGEVKAIIQGYDKILSKSPLHVPALVGKSRLLRVQGKTESARPLLEQAYRIAPTIADVRDELKELYEEILTESDETDVRFELAKLYYAEGDYDKAISLFQQTMRDFRFENESIKMLGQCFMAKGMLEFAFQEFKKLLVDDEVKELLYTLAQRYEQKGDYVGAKQVYRYLFSVDMNYRDVKLKFELLAGATSDPLATDRSTLITQLDEKARSRYELIEEIGRGAMGIVFRARDNELDEFVALKILPENLSQNPDAIHRFRAEARAARRLSHPNIVRIHDIGEEKGRKYISMEYIKGTDLKKFLRQKGKLSIEEALQIVLPLCDALDYAHSQNIVHRDIKPANILITEGKIPKLSDFGIAKALELTSETVTGAIIGTPLYMSPEQVQGQPVDHRADIYSLGIMLYEMLAGRPPFTEGDIAYQHCRVPARPIPEIPDQLNAIILKCLAKNKEDRWSTARELAETLRQFLSEWQENRASSQ